MSRSSLPPFVFVSSSSDPLILARSQGMATHFEKMGIKATFTSPDECSEDRDRIIIFVQEYTIEIVRELRNHNLVILDVGSSRIPRPEIHLFHGVIVDTVYMKRYVLEEYKFYGYCEIIYHPWRSEYATYSKFEEPKCQIGFIGDRDYEDCIRADPTDSYFPFNCHLCLGEESNVGLSRAAALDGVVITVPTPVNLDLLGSDYPFYLTTMENLESRWDQIKSSYGTPDWELARVKMDWVKIQTHINMITMMYLKLAQMLIVARTSWEEFQTWRISRQNKKIAYVVIFGQYDAIPELPFEVMEPEVDYVCFTDDPTAKSETYHMVYVPYKWNGTIDNREIKIRIGSYLDGYEYSAYMDGCVAVNAKFGDLFETILKHHEIAILEHPCHDCSYKEYRSCRKRGYLVDPERVERRMNKFRAEGFPENHGLTINNVIIRRHTPAMNAVMEQWMEELLHTERDQLCLEYVLWKHQIPIFRCRWSDLKACFVHKMEHEKNRKLTTSQWIGVYREM